MMNSNALCVMVLKYLIDNYITIISQCCSNSTLFKKTTLQNKHFIIILVDRYKKKSMAEDQHLSQVAENPLLILGQGKLL